MKREKQITDGAIDTSRRQKAYLVRLKASDGRRVVVDLNKHLGDCLDALVAAGYGDSQAQVIRRALAEAHAANCS